MRFPSDRDGFDAAGELDPLELRRLVESARRLPGVRLEKIQAVRHALRQGAYYDPAKLDVTVTRLQEILDGS